MKIELDPADLEPIIQATIDATLARVAEAEAKLPIGRLAYPEAEAAQLLGIAVHCLRDSRLRGEVAASRVGKKMLYQRGELLRFLAQQENN